MQMSSLSDLEATRDELLFEVHKMAQEEEGHKPDKTVSLLLLFLFHRSSSLSQGSTICSCPLICYDEKVVGMTKAIQNMSVG